MVSPHHLRHHYLPTTMSAAKQHNCLHQRSSPAIFSIQETFSDIPIQVTPCILPSPLNTSPVRPPAGRGLWTEQELKGQARCQREQLLSDSTVVGRDMSQKSCLKFHNTWPWAPGTLCDVGNEISSYTKRRVTGLPITWHYTYRFLLTGFGIFFSPLFPIPVCTFTILVLQEAHHSIFSIVHLPSRNQEHHPCHALGSSHVSPPGGNASHPILAFLPALALSPASLLNGSTCQISVRPWQGGWNLVFGREVRCPSSCSHLHGKSGLLGRRHLQLCF